MMMMADLVVLCSTQHNPLVSEEARERAGQRLQEMGADAPEE
jgi:hypothetical protein